MSDKLSERYTVPVPAHLKDLIQQLQDRDKGAVKVLNRRIRFEMARVVHERLMFDPDLYLTSDPAAVQTLLSKLIPQNNTKGKPFEIPEAEE